MGEPGFRVESVEHERGQIELRFHGRLSFDQARQFWDQVRAAARPDARGVLFNLADVESLDGGTSALLLAMRSEVEQRDVPAPIVGARGDVAAMLALYDDADCRSCTHEPPRRVGILQQVGAVTVVVGGELRGSLDFVGSVAAASLAALRRPLSVNWRDLGRLAERAGADALPIVSVIALLIGLVSAFQGASTLRQYGANAYVADMVGLAVTRLMGPLMTAIVVTGRSGSGYAAELGTMTVNEEIDALRTLGIDPVRYLVIPRVVALVLVVPLLTLLADIIGIIGGLAIGVTVLGVPVAGLLTRLQARLDLWDVGTGLIMSVAYALAIGLIACERGLSTRGGAEGVGRSTTSAVVTILFHLVFITSLFTILFQAWGI